MPVQFIFDNVVYIYDNVENRLDLHEIKKYILHLRVSVRLHQISKSCIHQLRRAFFLVFYDAKIGIILVRLLYKFICFIYVSYGKINKVFTFAYYQLIVDNRSKIKIISYKE